MSGALTAGLEADLAANLPAEALIQADLDGLHAVATSLRVYSGVLAQGAAALRRVEADGWTGPAATAFHDRFRLEPPRWANAADAFTHGADAIEGYTTSITPARATAETARGTYQQYLAITSTGYADRTPPA